MIAEVPAHGASVFRSIVPGDERVPTRGQQESREDSQKSGFARAVCAQESDRLTLLYFK